MNTTAIGDPACSTTVLCTATVLPNGADRQTNGTGESFAELVGERSNRFLQSNVAVANTQASQVFLGPTALGIFHNYTVSFGAQFPIYQDVGTAFPKERVRFAANFSYLLFQHGHSH
jgi:hypothetical protein